MDLDRSNKSVSSQDHDPLRTIASSSPRTTEISRRPSGTRGLDRPTEWLGTPKGRKSYTIKSTDTLDFPAPGLDERDHKRQVTTSSAPVGMTRHTLGASSSHHQSGFAVESSIGKLGESEGSPVKHALQPVSYKMNSRNSEPLLVGLTRHTLGVSSSLHESSFVADDGKPDPNSYKAMAGKNTKETLDVPSPGVDATDHKQAARRASAPVAVTSPVFGVSSAYHRPGFTGDGSNSKVKESVQSPVQITTVSSKMKSRKSEPLPMGLTRHTLGVSSSLHESSFVADDGKPDPEKYKAMMRESMYAQDVTGRSPGFVGGSPPRPPIRSSINASPLRPDLWLTPNSATRRSYKPNVTPSMLEPIPNLSGADKKSLGYKDEKPPLGQLASPKPFKSPSAHGDLTERKLTPVASTRTITPMKGRAAANGEHSPYMSPHEMVDRKKFLAAFSAFEKSPMELPLTPKLVSPKPAVKRNFTIADSAKLKEVALNDFSNHSHGAGVTDEIQYVMENLRKVKTAALEGMTDEQKGEWFGNQLDGNGTIQNVFKDMLEKGLISSNLGPRRMETICEAIEKLEGLTSQVSREDVEILSDTLRINLRKLTTTSSGAVDTIEQAIARLKKVRTEDSSVKEQVQDVIFKLRAVTKSMHDGQMAQFVQVFSEMEKAAPENVVGTEESTHVDDSKNKDRERARLAKERFSPQNANSLVQALVAIKNAKLNKRQIALTAAFVRDLKHVESDEDEKKSDEALEKLVKRIGSDRKSEIINVLRGLKPLRLNDRERADLAEIVRGFAVGRVFRNEIAEALMKLRNIHLTAPEAKEASGIMFSLRKGTKEDFGIVNSGEMAKLRKLAAPGRAEVVADVFSDLSKLALQEMEIDQLSAAVADLGAQALELTDHQMIKLEYIDGIPMMILDIPDGEDYADEVESLDMINYVKNLTKTSPAAVFRYLIDPAQVDPASNDEANRYNSVVGADGDDEQERTSNMTETNMKTSSTRSVRSSTEPPSIPSLPLSLDEEHGSLPLVPLTGAEETSSVPSVAPTSSKEPSSPELVAQVFSPETRERSAKLISTYRYHDNQGGLHDILSPRTEERAKKIRFSKKPQWRFSKHNGTVVGEKRWRFEEDFDADEVIYSPLSREQYDRRNSVRESITKNAGSFGLLDDDDILDALEKDTDIEKK